MTTSLRDLLDEYDLLGDAAFSSAHDFALRQRRLANWAAKARDAIAELIRQDARLDAPDPQPALSGLPPALESAEG